MASSSVLSPVSLISKIYHTAHVCSVEKCCIFVCTFSFTFIFFQNSHFCIVFHKKSCEFRLTSLLQKLFHPILPFIHRQLFLYATPFQLCKVVVKYFYFEFIAIDTRHKTQDTDVYVTLLTSKRQTKLQFYMSKLEWCHQGFFV